MKDVLSKHRNAKKKKKKKKKRKLLFKANRDNSLLKD